MSANGQADAAPPQSDASIFALDASELTPGAEFTSRGRTICEADLVQFAALTGDWHPQHADAEWAAQSRFGARVAHGMMVLSYAVGLIPFEPERVVALRGLDSVSFKRPVLIGDTIRVRMQVDSVRQLDDSHALVSLAWRIVNQDGRVVARAKVEALWRGSPATETELVPDRSAEAERAAEELYADQVLL